jgi:hypothetical protein
MRGPEGCQTSGEYTTTMNTKPAKAYRGIPRCSKICLGRSFERAKRLFSLPRCTQAKFLPYIGVPRWRDRQSAVIVNPAMIG